MHKVVLLVVAGLMFGCASLNDGLSATSTSQEKAQNPHLLRCSSGVPICRTVGGELNKSYRQCTCLDLERDPVYEAH
jgi:hypothetical protein